jgi:SNF2 family DNA or RNA helicase
LDKALSDDIGLGKTLSDDIGLGKTLSVDTDLFSEDLGQYFNSKIAEE